MTERENFFRNVLGITDPVLIKNLIANTQPKLLKKGELLQNVGDDVPYLYLLSRGLLRGFFYDSEGREITDCFGYIPGTPAVACAELNRTAQIGIEALENSALYSLPFEVVLPLMESNQQVMALYNRILLHSLQEQWENKIMLAQDTAPHRYLWFNERYPGLIDRVSHKYIASFLGISPVQLSRIRRAIREQNVQDAADL